MTPPWDQSYPDRSALKHEVQCMANAFVEVLLEVVPKGKIEGIHFKGSAQKEWDSPIDYVPELSDVDIHVLFSDDAEVDQHLGTAEQAMQIQAEVEKRYFAALADPVHVARPQLIVLNHLLKQADYLGSPKGSVTALYGPEPTAPDYDDLARVHNIAHRQLAELEEYLAHFPLHVVDKPGKYLSQSLRQIVWRVSPIGPKVLVLRGVAPEEAWGMNRTAVVGELMTLGEEQLAGDYAAFYLGGWQYFLSAHGDHDAARKALLSGIRAIRRAVQIARKQAGQETDSQPSSG